jgi:hypothetical protein
VTDKSDRVLLRYEIDEASLNRTIARANAARERLAQMRGTLAQINQAAQPTGNALHKMFDDADKSASKLSQRLDEVAKKSTRLRGTLPSQDRGIGDLRAGLAGGSGGGGLNALGRTESAVSRTGAALRGLGLGPVGDIVSGGGDILQLVGSLGQLGPVAGIAAAGVAGFAIGLKLAEESSKEAKRSLDALVSTQQKYYQDVESLTTEQVQREITVLERRRKIQQEATNESERALSILEKQTGISRNVGIAAPGQLGDAFRQLTGQLDENKKAVAETEILVGRYTGGLKSNAFAANDAAEAERKLLEERKKQIDEGINKEIEARRLLRTANTEQVKSQIAANNDEIEVIQKRLDNLAEQAAGNDELAATYDALAARLDKLKKTNEELEKALLPVIQAKDQVKKFFKDIFSGNIIPPEARAALSDFSERVKKATEAAIARDKALISAQSKYEDDVVRIQQSGQERRADIAGQFNDRLVAIAREATEAAGKSLRELEQKRADLATQFVRDGEKAQRDAAMREADIRIEAAREDEKAFRSHLRNLEKIRQEAQDREFELILNRDFAGLFFSRRQTNNQLRDASGSFVAERQERATGAKDQVDDLRRSIANERNERIIAYNQSLQDAQLAYIRDRQEANRQRQLAIQEAQMARNRDLQALSQSINAQLQARYRGYREELRLATLTAQARIDLENALLQRARKAAAEAQVATKRLGGGTPTFRALGGGLQAGQLSAVNEPGSSGRESFTTGGRTFGFPGPGLFIPSKAGMVNANRGGLVENLIFQITGGSNPEATARAVKPVVYEVLKEIVGR